MASIRSAFKKWFGSQQSKSATATSSASPEPKKPASSDEKAVIRGAAKQFSFEQLPNPLQQACMPFLTPSETLTFLRVSKQLREKHDKFYQPARAQQALFNLVSRLDVKDTFAAIKSGPDILDELQFPFKLIVRGRGGQIAANRDCLISGLDALGEYDVTTPDAKTEPCAIIPSMQALFPGKPPVQEKIVKQIAKASSQEHQLATEKRHQRKVARTRKFIVDVIQCNEISNDPETQRDFDSDLKTKLVQDFIQTAFQLNDAEKEEEFDNGEFGLVALDVWRFLGDFIDLFNQFIDEQDMIPDTTRDDPTQPTLGRYTERKAWIVDVAVYLAVHRFAQLCDLEVLDAGAGQVADGNKRPSRFDMRSNDALKRLADIGVSEVYGFFSGTKYAGLGAAGGGVPWAREHVAPRTLQNFRQTKTAAKTRAYAATRVSQEVALANDGLSSSPTATAARR